MTHACIHVAAIFAQEVGTVDRRLCYVCYCRSYLDYWRTVKPQRIRHSSNIFNMNEVLTPSQLKRLTEHKYSVEGSSICDPVMQKFWGWLIQQIPLHWAPNAITLAGLIVNIVTATILVIYSPDARQQVSAFSIAPPLM